MEIAQTNILSLVYDDRVCIRYVKSILNDGGTQQHIIITCHEVKNLVLKNFCFHLSMSHTYLHIRYKPVKYIMNRLKLFNPVMYKEYLSSPVQFIIDYLLHLIMIEEHYFRLDWNTVRRRSIYYGKVTGT